MLNRRVLTGLLLAAAPLTLGVAAQPATAQPAPAQPTCMGKPATIVGGVGTPGDDVIVASGDVAEVEAGAGDDLICVVDNVADDGVSIDAGPGDDSILVEQFTTWVHAALGAGADRYIGGPSHDDVRAGWPGDQSRDYVRTRGGQDDLVLDAGRVDADLGRDDDVIALVGADHGRGRLDGGRGVNTVFTSESIPDARIIDDLRADLSAHVLVVNHARYNLTAVSDLILRARHLTLRGDGKPNILAGYGCSVDMWGGPGNDHLSVGDADDVIGRRLHCPFRSHQYGEAGNDDLLGGHVADVLIGGSGHDTARGREGLDRCSAEKEWSCEK
jgi:Ca2+-binding RTX toxin-like protein